MIARIRDGYIVDDRPDPIEYLEPMYYITESVTDADYYPLPHERGEVVTMEQSNDKT